jgi:hypothetical protein
VCPLVSGLECGRQLSLVIAEAAEGSLPLAVLSDLFDMHTIDACMKLFDWLESRSARLTKVRSCS